MANNTTVAAFMVAEDVFLDFQQWLATSLLAF
jgi:hypothetical protein